MAEQSDKVTKQIGIGIAVGAIIGAGVYADILPSACSDAGQWVGSLFLSLLKMVIVPLIAASLIVAVTGLSDITRLGRLGVSALVYYFCTTSLAVIVGLLVVNLIQPGVGANLGAGSVPDAVTAGGEHASVLHVFANLFSSMIPSNVLAAFAETKVLSIIFFSLFFGICIALAGEKARPLASLFAALNEVMMKMTGLIMRLAPFGVGALIIPVIAGKGIDAFGELGLYIVAVLAGLFLHGAVILPLLYTMLTRKSPLAYARAMLPAISTAFGTASSSATLPVTIRCAEERGKVRNETASFVLPLGATVNMDGTALYESIAAMFIAQAYGIELSIGQQLVIFITASLASIGAAGIPSAGLITMGLVLNAVGLPLEGIGLILAVDRILDMFRTSVNVWGDSLGASLLDIRMGKKEE